MAHSDGEELSQEPEAPRGVYCLAIDLVGSTASGLELTTLQLDRFNAALVKQIRPYLERLGLSQALLKFTGDGWLVMTEEQTDIPVLCCLALIMQGKFRKEMARETRLSESKIPPLRLAICSGRDIPVTLPDDRPDYVGDSARRAVRASKSCCPDEILIGEPIREFVFRDFHVSAKKTPHTASGRAEAKGEEEFPLHVLGPLKAEASVGSDSPEHFVNTLAALGQTEEASRAAERASDSLRAGARGPVLDAASLTERWSRLLASQIDYDTARRIQRTMNDAGIPSDVTTYNALIAKAPGSDERTKLLAEMSKAGIGRNVGTYNVLIARAGDTIAEGALLGEMRAQGVSPDRVTVNLLCRTAVRYERLANLLEIVRPSGEQAEVDACNLVLRRISLFGTGLKVLEEMHREGVRPDANTYRTLIARAPDYASAQSLATSMKAHGLRLDRYTYRLLSGKAPDYTAAVALLQDMQAQGVEPDRAIYEAVVERADDYEAAAAVLRTMCDKGVAPSSACSRAVLRHAPNLEAGQHLAEDLLSRGVGLPVAVCKELLWTARDPDEAVKAARWLRARGLKLDTGEYEFLMKRTPDYPTGAMLLDEARGAGLEPTLAMYNSLIRSAPDYKTALAVIGEMRAAGTEPDAGSYTFAAMKADNYGAVDATLRLMRSMGLEPKRFDYSALVRLAPSYETAKREIEGMEELGIVRCEAAYTALFDKDLASVSADDIARWYLQRRYHPSGPVGRAIQSFRRTGRTDQALRLALHYPHLQSALDLFRESPEAAISYFSTVLKDDPTDMDADHGLAWALWVTGKLPEARAHMERALVLAGPGYRKHAIERSLRRLDEQLAAPGSS